MSVIKIKSTHPESQGPFVLINEEDFDATKHRPYDESAEGAGDGAAGSKSLDEMTVAELKAFAEAEGIDLADAKKKEDIRAAIDLAQGN